MQLKQIGVAFATFLPFFVVQQGAPLAAEMRGPEAFSLLSGKSLKCRGGGATADIEFATASADNRRVAYEGYFKGNRIRGEYLAEDSGRIVRADGRLERTVELLDDGRIKLGGTRVPTLTCK